MQRWILFLVIASNLWAGTVMAQTKEEFEAFTLYKTSQQDLDAGKYDAAIEKLDRAYKLFPMPHILIRKAEAYWKKGDMDTALDLFRQVKSDDPKVLAKVQKAVSDILYQMNQPVSVQLSIRWK
ncbi:MAG: tetratricopeptide repeat protein [Deltaproteobacteria bacterium]|nr:tetratricopeptide repeat protein [Deltaproteobacteria bacterium]